jgi:hypothetical protein
MVETGRHLWYRRPWPSRCIPIKKHGLGLASPAAIFLPLKRRRQLIDEALVERALGESDDMEWAKPYVDEALAQVKRGEVITREEHEARNEARLAAMK